MTLPVAAETLVGRAAELARIEVVLGSARSGEASALLLSGEAGVGKSRLLAEMKSLAVAADYTVLEGASFEFDRAIPLAPFGDLVRTFLLRAPADITGRLLDAVGTELTAIAPEIARRSSRPHSDEERSPDEEKQRAFNGVCTVVGLLAEERPVLVILEDLHWADDLSLELFLVLARRMRPRPVVLVGTYRSDEVEPLLGRAISQLTHARLAEVVQLGPFGLEETQAFVQQIAGAGTLRADVVRSLYALTEGNAFFLEEVSKSFGPSFDALRADTAATQLPLGVIKPPESIREAVRRRTSQLSPSAGHVLSVAAVTGRRFEFDILGAVTGIADSGLVPLLRELVDAQLVVEELPDRFTFRHALTQQAVLAGLLGRERRQLHLQVAEAIRVRGRDSDVPDLANHYFQAESWELAANYAIEAGERAMAMFSPSAAAEQFDRAMVALEAAGMQAGWELRWARARAYDTLGDFQRAREGYEAAVAEAQRTGQRKQEWQGLVDLGLLWSARDYQSARGYLERSLELARTLGDADLLAQSLNRVGNFHVNALHPGEAMALHHEALAIAQELGDEARIGECFDLLGMASLQAAELIAADSFYERAIDSFRKVDNRHGLASALAVRAVCSGGNITDTEEPCRRPSVVQLADVEEALALAQASGWRAGEAFACAAASWIHAARGDYNRALVFGQRSLALAEEIDHRQWIVAACCAVGRLHAEVFAYDAGQRYLERGVAVARELQSPLWICNVGGSLAMLLARRGQLERAAEELSEIEAYLGSPNALHAHTVFAAAAVVAITSGRPAKALEAIGAMDGGADRLPVPLRHHLRGEALAALGRMDEAEAAFSTAIELSAAMGLRPQTLRSQLELARVLRACGRRAAAAAAFEAARATATGLATELPAGELRDAFRAEMDLRLPPAPQLTSSRAAKQAFEGLTAREREVASLIAGGLTNRAIADALILSERTVEAHVSNILAKLDLTSRAHIAAWATERGLST